MGAQSFLRIVALATVGAIPVGCGGGGDDDQSPTPTVTIINPTSGDTWTTSANGLIVGGQATYAGAVDVQIVETGATYRGYVVYNPSDPPPRVGSWFAQVQGLQLGQNTLVATTVDDGGTGGKTASDKLIVTRVP